VPIHAANAFGGRTLDQAAGVGLAVAMFVREKAVRRRAVAAGDEAGSMDGTKPRVSR